MISYKCCLVVLVIIFSTCSADSEMEETGRKRLKHKLYHHPYLFYLAFLAIKLKFAFVVGTIITVFLFASKFYALLKYGILTQKNNNKEPEKIYIHSDSSYPSYFSAPERDNHDDHETYESSSYGSSSYGRDFGDEIFYSVNSIPNVLNFDLTEFAFNSIDLKDTPCRQRFVCEADFRARSNKLLGIGAVLLRDNGYMKYQTNYTINNLDDCRMLFKDCSSLPNNISVF